MMSGGAVARFAQMSPVAAVAGVFLVILCAVAIDADQLAPVDPMAADYSATHAPPMPGHLMGTDQLGRDILSRVIYGARISLFVGFVSVLFGDSVGLIWGIVSGYLGGRVDLISQRLLDVVLSFPGLILAMLLLAGMGAGLQTVVTAIAVTRVPLMTRIIRSQVLATKQYAFVEASRSIGASQLRIMLRDIAPQTIAPFLVVATANIGAAIVTEAGLSFLGVGVPPPAPSWGNLLGGALAGSFRPMWWLVVFPGLLLTLTVLAANLFGDGVRDFLDPRLRRQPGRTPQL